MKLRHLKFSGLFSYPESTEIDFPEGTTVITGTNNSGKTNIFRVIELVASTLASDTGRFTNASEFIQGASAHTEIGLSLSVDEAKLIGDYLSFYEKRDANNNNPNRTFYEFDRETLATLIDKITIKFDWQVRYVGYGFEPHNIQFTFDKLDLTFFARDLHTELSVKVPSIGELPDIRNLLAVKTLEANPKCYLMNEELRENQGLVQRLKTFGKGTQLQKAIEYLPFQHYQGYSQTAMELLQGIITYANSGNVENTGGIRFLEFFGMIMQRGIHRTGGSRVFKPGAFDFTDKLIEDGSNLAQFLYNLKNSPRLEARKRFSQIKDAFEDIMSHQQLSFDVVVEYKEDKTEEDALTRRHLIRRTPYQTNIVIIDKKLDAQFPLGQSGSGLGEILYLLALSYGVTNSAVLMDEPAINLHPPQMSSLMKKLIISQTTAPKSGNQFIVITHSAELARILIFDNHTELLHVQKESNGFSKVRKLDAQTLQWFHTERELLKHRIDSRIFFGKLLILTEGESDTDFLMETIRHLSNEDGRFDILKDNTMVINVNGKGNFPKYKNLLESLHIPYAMLGDKDVTTNDSKENVRKLFEKCSTIDKKGIDGDNNRVFVIKNGNLEGYMKEMDGALFSTVENEVRQEYGRVVKSAMASEFIRRLSISQSNALEPLRQLIGRILELHH